MGEGHRNFTIDDVHQHRFRNDAWVAIDGRVLDITPFVSSHPGGDVITLCAGIDGTILFNTYHPAGVPKHLVDKLVIGTLVPQSTHDDQVESKSYYSWSSKFYTTLRCRVVKRLHQLRRPRRGGFEIWIKAIFLLAIFWGALAIMIASGLQDDSGRSTFWTRAMPASVVMGLSASFIGTCVQHDGNHGAFSTVPLFNKIAGWTLDMIGASAFTWEIQHMLGHHPYTNLLDIPSQDGEYIKASLQTSEPATKPTSHRTSQESDPDVFSSFPFMRMHPAHRRLWYHRFQHFYAPLLFALMTLSKVFQQDWQMFTERRLYHISADCRYGRSRTNSIRFVVMKLLSLIYMLVLPCWSHGLLHGSILFAIGHLVCGEMLATMFIVNHVIDGVAFAQRTSLKDCDTSMPFEPPKTSHGKIVYEPKLDRPETSTKQNDWAAVQCQTSVNWASGSWFWNHFSGGLNHQIEHHLFPSVCHTNYVHIQDIVEATCKEFGVPYRSEASLWTAYRKMLLHLRKMGSF